MRALQRRSISGCVIFYCGCLLKAFARHQASVTLSSCEAELAAIQGAIQEAVGIQRTLNFAVQKELCIELRTDSLSEKQLLEASDVQRRSRHIEIRIEWIRDLMHSGKLTLTFVPGILNPADMLTKCLPSAEHRRYREVLGYQIRELPVVSVASIGTQFLGDESGVLMSRLGEIRTCLLCGDPLGPVGRASEGSSLDTSSVLASLLVEMSSSSESDGTRRRQLGAASLPAEGTVIGETPGEGPGAEAPPLPAAEAPPLPPLPPPPLPPAPPLSPKSFWKGAVATPPSSPPPPPPLSPKSARGSAVDVPPAEPLPSTSDPAPEVGLAVPPEQSSLLGPPQRSADGIWRGH